MATSVSCSFEFSKTFLLSYDVKYVKILNFKTPLCWDSQLASETMVAIGDPRDAICDAVDQLNPTFLIVGSHGYGAIKRCHMCFSQIRLLS